MRIELQPTRVLVNDRLYERPLFGAVAFPDDTPQGYVCAFGALARPTPTEAEGYEDTPDLEPFRNIRKHEQAGQWRYTEDILLELITESLLPDLRALQERICDFALEYKTPHFYCHPGEKDLAAKSCGTVYEICRRRFAGRRNPQFEYIPVINPAFLPVGGCDKTLENTVRTQISLGHLSINDGCRHALSQNPLALRALGVGVYQGVNFPMTTQEEEHRPVKRACDTYGQRG